MNIREFETIPGYLRRTKISLYLEHCLTYEISDFRKLKFDILKSIIYFQNVDVLFSVITPTPLDENLVPKLFCISNICWQAIVYNRLEKSFT